MIPSAFQSNICHDLTFGHEKALGKARKSGAEGESLKLLKESGAIVLVHIRFVFIFSS